MKIINPFRFDDLQCGDKVWSADYGHGELEPINHSTGERVVRFLNREKKSYHCLGRFGYQLEDEKSLIWPSLPFAEGGYALRDNGEIYKVDFANPLACAHYSIEIHPINKDLGAFLRITPSGHLRKFMWDRHFFWPLNGGIYPKFYVGMSVTQINTKKVGEVCDVIEDRWEVPFPVGVRWNDGGPKEWFTMNGQGIEDGPRIIFPLEQNPQSSGVNDNERGEERMISNNLQQITKEIEIGFWRGLGEKLPGVLLSQAPRLLRAVASEYIGEKSQSTTSGDVDELIKKVMSSPVAAQLLAELRAGKPEQKS